MVSVASHSNVRFSHIMHSGPSCHGASPAALRDLGKRNPDFRSKKGVRSERAAIYAGEIFIDRQRGGCGTAYGCERGLSSPPLSKSGGNFHDAIPREIATRPRQGLVEAFPASAESDREPVRVSNGPLFLHPLSCLHRPIPARISQATRRPSSTGSLGKPSH